MYGRKYETIKIHVLKKAEYSKWKVKMLMYLEAADLEYLDMMNDGSYVPKKMVLLTPTVPEHYIIRDKKEWTPEEKAEVLKNAKVRISFIIVWIL